MEILDDYTLFEATMAELGLIYNNKIPKNEVEDWIETLSMQNDFDSFLEKSDFAFNDEGYYFFKD